VNDQLGNKIQYILDGGECRVGIESTIMGFDNEKATIYRLGGLSIEDIEIVIGKTEVQLNSSSNPKSPGQLISHYAPRRKVVWGLLPELLIRYANSKIGILAFQKKVAGINPSNQIVLSDSGNLEEAAKNLFAALRELDKKNIELILAESVPNFGLGKAINDRLRRASAE
jgi:L-threonylcarbamoyladenylate synthase